MDAHRSNYTETQLRNAALVMAPDRLGAMHQNRISFVRSLIRKMAKQQWQVTKHEWQLCPRGFGHVIYKLATPSHVYHLVVFCDEIADEERNDRVIAEKWDVTFALVQGDVDVTLLEQLRANVPLQEAGRNPNNVLVLARANKSVRVFEHIVRALAKGEQPQPQELAEVGYILRTTAVYGNGKFGIADFKLLEENPDFNQSFSAQMCAVYILREFSLDWVHYLAEQQGGDKAIVLHKGLQRYLGVGNATGLGMAPYLINHPCIVDQWMTSRERAVADVLVMPCDSQFEQPLSALLAKAKHHLEQVITINEHQDHLNHQAIVDIEQLLERLPRVMTCQPNWSAVLKQAETMSLEAQEILTSCLLELYPTLVDKYENQMNTSETLAIPSRKSVEELLTLLKAKYQWAVEADYSLAENSYWFWYRSQDKEEPRLGVRGEEIGEERELPLDIGRQANRLYLALSQCPQEMSVAEFLLQHPQYRAITRRVWTLGSREMGDIQMNVLREDALPMHLLRCKLAVFGATKFDPRSDRWVRVTFFQGAPLLEEINDPNYCDTWIFPTMPSAQEVAQSDNQTINGGIAS
ncbi:hypothetical protein VIOR3934_13467 [Vibrio orientalis CIP 102891 = ATCC 33934]|uniref:Uncharacterized protein n=1 Tax=Vibrio orientalis CIP 102891 = ATCC 33934 TaxID=675816 RepID=C9QGY8_VIBOR|nr:hypothetical protein [Vibrio orientalis]EEX93536.1 hypothetical protein VIA_000693 [Vibrio orientalis CIP 102891 = ATCC 33934]EGU46060.1 hypothetical protein VIOR3934_13467 [Vibrio orientalis CIP 102891 = ATCC 33934]